MSRRRPNHAGEGQGGQGGPGRAGGAGEAGPVNAVGTGGEAAEAPAEPLPPKLRFCCMSQADMRLLLQPEELQNAQVLGASFLLCATTTFWLLIPYQTFLCAPFA